MITYEEELSTALRELARQDGDSITPVDNLLRRGRQAKRTRAVGLTAAVASAAALAAVVAAGVSASMPVGGSGDTATLAAQSPQMRLAAAAQATVQGSFRFKLGGSLASNDPGAPGGRKHYAGAWDPSGPDGYLTDGSDVFEIRIVGGQAYHKKGQAWFSSGSGSKFEIPGSYISGTAIPGGLTADPAQQLKALRSLGTVTDEGRSGTVERYSFRYVATGDGIQMPTTIPVSGTVEVGVGTGKVSKISYEVVLDFKGLHEQRTLIWEFSDYGTSVTVERPATS